MEGNSDDINRLLSDSDRVMKLGQSENVRHLLAAIATPQNINIISPYLQKGLEPTAAFVMVQGTIIGLILRKTPNPKLPS